MYHTGQTIEKTLEDIQRHKLVLPAIQREFVWHPDQICRLFDSIMQGYPFGTFLYWKVAPENSDKFKFYGFVRNYHERDNPHCPPLGSIRHQELTAVLDGQQRLTAFNIGLNGSIARKLPHKRWSNPDAFPTTKLHLDLLWQPDDDNEDGTKYRFSFITENQATSAPDNVCWFPIGSILSMSDELPAMVRWLNRRLPQHMVDAAMDPLFRLYEVTRKERLVAYYEEDDQELDKALQIFIRMNDGGTPLSHSDLLLSIAVAQWVDHDAREEIHNLVDQMNRLGSGFSFSQDLVLKAGLMLSDIGSVGFRVDNFSRENMATFEGEWEDIKRALVLTVQLIASYGFSGQNLTAHNAILPIAYYLHYRKLGETYLTSRHFRNDRESIRRWLVKSLLKTGVWGSGLDTLLTDLRRSINENGNVEFPVDKIQEAMARKGRQLVFDEEEIEDLADMRYGDRLTFALLSLLFPFVDLRNQFHVDHIFPSTRFNERQLRKSDVPEGEIEAYRDRKDRLANLQLLQGVINNEKGTKMPAEWLSAELDRDREMEYRKLHLLGEVPISITDFGDFYEQRRAKLRQRISELLGRQSSY